MEQCYHRPSYNWKPSNFGANVDVTAVDSIGKHAVEAAGAVVTKDIPPYSIAVGNPVRVIKQYDFEQKAWVKV